MNGCRVFVVVTVAVLLMLLFPMTAATDSDDFIFDSELKVNEGIKIEYSISIEVVEVSRIPITSAKFRILSYQKPAKECWVYKGDSPLFNYNTNSDNTLYIDVIGVYSESVRFTVTGPANWEVTDYYTVEGEESETDAVTVPKLEIARTIDPNTAEIGQTVKVTLTIKNTGNGTATDIMLDEGTIAKTYREGCPSAIDDIAAGATERIGYDLKIGEDAQSGTREMPPSVLNYKGESGDSYSTESQSGVLEILHEPVLLSEPTISIDPIDYVVTCGDDVPMVVTITNIGNATAEDVYVKCDLPPGVRVAKGELEPVYDLIKPGDSKEYEVTLVASEEGRYIVEVQVRGSDRGADASFEFRAEKSGLEKYYIYIIAAIPILLILLWIIKRRREYSY